jgi:hypothetical protein
VTTRWLLALAACGDAGDEDCYQRTFWGDTDGDGYGAFGSPVSGCEQPDGAVQNSEDCDDGDPARHPGAEEICNDRDDDCDGNGDVPKGTWYADADGDGYGNGGRAYPACSQPPDTVADATDCDDTDPAVNPGAEEVCDGDDDDCSGQPDAGGTTTWYADEDGDGYGDEHAPIETCDPDAHWVQKVGDCDPTNEDVHPGAVEVCNGLDDDCDGQMLFCGYAGDYDLTDAPTKLYGSGNDDAGRLVDAGDLDGDGDDEIVVATLYASSYSGGGYIVDGPPPTGQTDLVDLIEIEGSSDTYGAGRSIGTGDSDGDGYEDVVFGAPYSPGGNEAFVIFGPIDESMELIDADVDLKGENNTYTGHGSDLGDVTGDGIADATIGAYNTNGGRGSVFVVKGPLEDGDYDLDDADGTYESPVSGYCGRVIRSGLDVTGDGIGEIMAPAAYASAGAPNSGLVYVVEGPPSGDVDLGDDAYATILGSTSSGLAGQDVALGDVDGDGRADAIVGAPYTAHTGIVSWVSGERTGEIDVEDGDGVLSGPNSSGFGMNVDAKDIDGDGRTELLVGAPTASGGPASGATYLFYTPIEGEVESDEAGATFYAEHNNDELGTGVAFADIDGDTSTDLLIGAPSERTNGPMAGIVYVLSPDPK